MVADAFEVFGDHEQVERVLPVFGVGGNLVDQPALDLIEGVVHDIVLGDDRLCQHCITLNVGVNTFRDHMDGRARHFAQQIVIFRRTSGEKLDDLRNVLGLVANALHVRDHLQRRRDLAQIARDRLLLQQELEAQRLDVALLLVDLRVERPDLLRQLRICLRERPGRERDDFLAQCAHLDHLLIQECELFIKPASHQPNLPVM